MINIERYAKEIAKIACSGELFSIQKGQKTPIACSHAICIKCLFFVSGRPIEDCCSVIKRAEWARSES